LDEFIDEKKNLERQKIIEKRYLLDRKKVLEKKRNRMDKKITQLIVIMEITNIPLTPGLEKWKAMQF